MNAKCPVCNRLVILEEHAARFIAISYQIPCFLSRRDLLEAVMTGSFHDSHSSRKEIHWACDDCISNGEAILADPSRQKYCDCAPYYAYFDLHRTCQTCGKPYVFSKSEQRFWYEDLQFWVQSQPKECLDCRKERRMKKTKKPEI